MALDVLHQAAFSGPALPEPFVRFELERELGRRKLLPKTTGAEGRELQESWQVYRRKLRDQISQGGAVRVRNHVIEPLVPRLGYQRLDDAPEVETREGLESGGYLLADSNGARLRVWSTAFAEDLDAPARRGRAYRFSHTRIAQRVLLATGERVGLLTNGLELRILISDPARPDSQIEIPIEPYWKRSRAIPDTYRLLVALASPAGVQAVPDLVDKARLQQTRVTKELRQQARQAVQRFVQELLDHPENRDWFAALEGTRFDMIVSNPPYVAAGDPHLGQGDVRFEPRQALVAGPEGMDDLERIIGAAPGYLNEGAWLLCEHGHDQGDACRRLLERAGFVDLVAERDLAGILRVSGGRWLTTGESTG